MGHLEYKKTSNHMFSEFGCHMHGVYEIYYFVSGDVEIMVEGRIFKLTPHSLIIFPPNVLHGCQVNSREEYVRYCLYISPQDMMPERRHLLTDIIPSDIKSHSHEILYEHTEAFQLEQFYTNLNRLEQQPEEIKQIMEPIFTEALVAQLNLMCRTLKPTNSHRQISDKIHEIVSFINQNLMNTLSLDFIANHFFISKNYLNHSFKEAFGTTVMEYVRYKRVVLARQHILNGETAMNAALLSGFSDYSSFYRTYIKYMNTPPRADIPANSKILHPQSLPQKQKKKEIRS